LFTLAESEQTTETAAIFAGTGSEVNVNFYVRALIRMANDLFITVTQKLIPIYAVLCVWSYNVISHDTVEIIVKPENCSLFSPCLIFLFTIATLCVV
jgi:hypothetical protein